MIEIKNKNGEVIYIYNGKSLVGANLRYANLYDADLSGANLSGANIHFADLSNADLTNADFSHADFSFTNLRNVNIIDADLTDANLTYAEFRGANLSYTNLSFANLYKVDFREVSLRGVNLHGANLRGADLRNVDLREANLRGADLFMADITDAIIDETTKGLNDKCPKTGSFIGYKKCYFNGIPYIVELEIPADARRSSATDNKCRCDKAKVLSITSLNGRKTDVTEVNSWYNHNFVYKIGEIVEEPNFDDKYWIECTSGIHFFMDRADAVIF